MAVVRGVDGRVVGECLDDTLEPDKVVRIAINYENASLKMLLERSRLLGDLNSRLMAVIFFLDHTEGGGFGRLSDVLIRCRLDLGLDVAGVEVAQAVVGGYREGDLLNLVRVAA